MVKIKVYKEDGSVMFIGQNASRVPDEIDATPLTQHDAKEYIEMLKKHSNETFEIVPAVDRTTGTTVYCGKNKRGVWKASLDRSKIWKYDDQFECNLEKVHDKVYMLTVYYGFDYGVSTIYDVIKHSPLYHSMSAAKKDGFWVAKEKLAKENPDKYHVTPYSIASDDCGVPFTYGDSMDGNFNMKIIGIKLI